MAKKKEKVRYEELPIDTLRPNDWNPNEMQEPTFRFLVNRMKALGNRSAILVTEDGIIIDGEHRWKAAKELGHKTIPAMIVDDDILTAMLETVNMNLIKGEFNSVKYGKLIDTITKSYTPEDLTGLLITPKEDVEMMQKIIKNLGESVSPEDMARIMQVGKKGSHQFTLSFKNDEDFEVFRTTTNTVKSDRQITTTDEAVVYLCQYYIDTRATMKEGNYEGR